MLNWPETILLVLIALWPSALHTVTAAQKALTYSMLGLFHEKGRRLELSINL
jgi:uncharacterized membrane protein